MSQLVLSLFPGIGLLDMAFEEEGFCIVRGPDLLWGGDIRRFHPPAGKFDGVIGGPPCQAFSELSALIRANGHEPRFGNLIPEFERCVEEADPLWFVMENVMGAPIPKAMGYENHSQKVNNRWLGAEQIRERRITFGTHDGRRLHIEYAALIPPRREARAVISGNGFGSGSDYYRRRSVVGMPGVTSSDGGRSVRMVRYSLEEACRLQGLAEDHLKHVPFTKSGALSVVANGVPLPMGRAIAKGVKKAFALP